MCKEGQIYKEEKREKVKWQKESVKREKERETKKTCTERKRENAEMRGEINEAAEKE